MTDAYGNSESFWRINNPIIYGLVISAALIGGYVILGFQKHCIATFCETNFDRFFSGDPNEIGDTLAGLFAAQAFVWIIVTVFLQSHELREQRKEFREQREATQDMARGMAAQVALIKNEQLQRQQEQASRELERLLEGLAFAIDQESRESNVLGWGGFQNQLKFFSSRAHEPLDLYLRNNSTAVHEFWLHYAGEYSNGDFVGWIGYYEGIFNLLSQIQKIKIRLAPDQIQRLKNQNLENLQTDLGSLLRSTVWGDESALKQEFTP